MGANRLAMVDHSPRSNQPMQLRDSSSAITFNGEIYNHHELRHQLLHEGVEFQTESDTEVLLAGLDRHGIAFLSQVNGMFAFAYFDAEDASLYLCRDSLGKKPLYFKVTESGIAWSSNLASFQGNSFELNDRARNCYLRFGYLLDPETIFMGVDAVFPNEVVKYNLRSVLVERKKFIRNSSLIDKTFREALTRAVASRISDDDTIGVSLSGGLDSSLVALVGTQLGLELESYTAIWEDSDKEKYNLDAMHARKIADKLGIAHHEVPIFRADELPSKLYEFVRTMEEPNNNPTGLSMLDLYSTMANNRLRLVLTGDGADEVFKGYSRYDQVEKIPKILNLQTQFWPSLPKGKLGTAVERLISAQFSASNYSNWGSWHEVFTPSEVSELLGTERIPDQGYFKHFQSFESKSKSEVLQEQDLNVWIPMESNRRLDRISMAYSIEARSPFLDENLLNFGRELRKANSNRIKKSDLFYSEFPELRDFEILKQKTGFISPIGHWLRSNQDFVKEHLTFLSAEKGFNSSILGNLQQAPSNGNFEGIKKVWTLLVYSVWLKVVKE
jgi:asparagine synthase (glutamine-hydrolysing)